MNKEDILKNSFKIGLGIVGIGITYLSTSEKVQNSLNSLEKDLKSDGHDIVGGAVETVKKILGDIGNVAKASPYTPALSSISDKITFDEALRTFKKGDHIAVDRKKHISHHGIYTGDGFVIDYNKDGIKYSSLENFLSSSFRLYRINSQAIYSREEIVRRAKRRLGECKYNPITNNCEQFARWCRNGD